MSKDFKFNPTVWFVCKICRKYYETGERLTEHKLKDHLGDCLRIKCIVFEENLLDYEWMPPDTNTSQLNQNLMDCQIFDSETSSLQITSTNPTQEILSIKNPSNTSSAQLPSSPRNLIQPKPKSLAVCNPVPISLTDEANHNHGGPLLTENEQTWETPTSAYVEEESPDHISTASAVVSVKIEAEDPFQEETITASVNSDDEGSNGEGLYLSVRPEASILSPSECSADKSPTDADQFEDDPLNNNTQELNSNLFSLNNFEALQTVKMEFVNYDDDPFASSLLNLTPGQIQTETVPLTMGDPSDMEKHSCTICLATFSHKRGLRQHMRCHSDVRPFPCPQCPLTFKYIQALDRHLILHGKPTPFRCRFCSKPFCSNVKLADHERTHTGERPFKCHVANCDCAFPSKTTLHSHLKAKHSAELGYQQFFCPACGKAFGLKSLLSVHFRVHHTSEDELFKCDQPGCFKGFKLKRSLKDHSKVCRFAPSEFTEVKTETDL